MRARRHPATTPNEAWGLDKLGLSVLLSGYAVLLGASYLFAFWRPFGFSIFPYLGLQDYVSASLNRIAVLVASPLVLAAIVFGSKRLEERRLARDISIYLVFLYGVAFAIEFHQAATRYLNADFRFNNETTVLLIALLLFLAGVALTCYAYRATSDISIKVAALIFAQSAVSVAAGYSDGKTLFNGALQIHFLGNNELCEPAGVSDWVYLGAFGGRTFFMNTIDKRLCLTDEKNIRLVSRQFKEGR
jgi:hypothetical protein